MLDSTMNLLARPEEDKVEKEIERPDLEETIGYTPPSSQLHNAGKKEEDPFKEIKDPKEFLVTSLARISTQALDKCSSIIQQSLEPTNQVSLTRFCSRYRCTIV